MACLLMVLALHSITADIREYTRILNALEGTWTIEYAEHRGVELVSITESQHKLKGLQIKIDRLRFSFRFNNEWLPKAPLAPYEIYVSKSKSKGIIDFTLSIPFICSMGIYRIANDELTVCFAAFGLHDDKDLPKQFATSKEDHFYLLKLRKIK
ncbi:MAG: hypothetical protein U0796_04655 [Gemmatales bacterium]